MTIRYICWQPLLTDHQAYTYDALRDMAGGLLSVNVGRVHDSVRAAQGWVNTGGGNLAKQHIPEKAWRAWAREQLDLYPDAIHLFGSPFEQRRQIQIMSMACQLGRKVALISEPFSPNGVGYLTDVGRMRGWLKASLRPLLYRFYGLHFARKIHAVFGISPLACDQYAEMGIARDRIFPFGYFVPGPISKNSAQPIEGLPQKAPLRLVFVGALIARKGLHVAIDAVRRLRNRGHEVTLDVYGPGEPADYPFDEGIRYCGVIPFGHSGETIARYDAMILPSVFDGWAVVVNEALQAGVPVCCSDAVGAGAVVRSHAAGATFPVGDPGALAAVIHQWIADPATLAAVRAGAQRVAPLLEPRIAAQYIHQAIKALEGDGARPDPAWYMWPRDTRA